MLQIKTVEPSTFAILKELMQIKELNDFSLVGGTALSLKYGHRISVDLDLFSENGFENSSLIDVLKNNFSTRYVLDNSIKRFGIFCFIDGVKIDIVKHKHPLLKPVETIDGIRMYASEDLVAMKINAILGRGKKKDFWDLNQLLKVFSLKEIIPFYEQKFAEQRLLISIPQAITYFDEADESETPICLNNLTWNEVKQNIKKAVREYLK